MLFSEKVDSCVSITRAFFNKKGRWPTHLELLEYVIYVHKVKRDTAMTYINEALGSRKLRDMVSHLEVV